MWENFHHTHRQHMFYANLFQIYNESTKIHVSALIGYRFIQLTKCGRMSGSKMWKIKSLAILDI